MMKDNTIHINLHASDDLNISRDCKMSVELFQNASLTMGELRDMMRETGVSWEFIQHLIDEANHKPSPVDKAFRKMEDYQTGPGQTLRNKPKNVW